jgi:hypothetical protein
MDPISRLRADPFNIKEWFAVWQDARKKGCFFFVRSGPGYPWMRIELVQPANEVIWMCKEGINLTDEHCSSFDPATDISPPFLLSTTGEIRYGRVRNDFQNT